MFINGEWRKSASGKDFDSLRSDVFTADAHIDYSVFGGSVGDLRMAVS